MKGLWTVTFSSKAEKQIKELKKKVPKVSQQFALLIKEIEIGGPWRRNWPHYGMLKGKGDLFHCHIKSGKPTFVAC